jgi:hypothetical protein
VTQVRKWLARLSFPLIVLAVVLVLEGRRARERGESAVAYYVGAALLAGAGMAGVRERHRPQL